MADNGASPNGERDDDHIRPAGKLGIIIVLEARLRHDRLATKTGATADELVEATGWQRHSVLGALSRLRSRGFTFQLEVHADRKMLRIGSC